MQLARRTAVAVALLPAALCSSSTALAQHTYILDDGQAEAWSSASYPATDAVGVLQGFRVPGGGADVVENISALLTHYRYEDIGGPPIDGHTLRIGVWDDPNADGNPSDAVLLSSYAGHVIRDSTRGYYVTYAFPSPVPVDGAFFIGIEMETLPGNNAVCAIDTSQGYRWDSWTFRSTNGPADLVNLNQNAVPPHNILLPGRYCLRANDGDYGTAIGTVSCLPAPNSNSHRALLNATGNDDLSSGPWRLVLAATYLPENSTGFLLASQTQQMPWVVPPGSMGRLCLGGSILRIVPSLGDSMQYAQPVTWEVDLSNVDSLGAGVPGIDAVQVGESWNFQYWYRDLDPGPTSNLTEMVTVTFH